MTKILLALAYLLAAAQLCVAAQHTIQGVLLEVNPAKSEIVVSCDAVPGYMDAMVMPFQVREPASLKTLAPGATVRFTFVEKKNGGYAEHIQTVRDANYESEPTEAARLSILHRAMDPSAAAKIVPVGQPVPDFTLIDQAERPTHLSDFRGKVVVVTFGYSRCPNPSYCFRLSNNLAVIKRRFHNEAGKDLILMTIVIDPAQDRGKALERYADTWKDDPAAWRFLTGSLADVHEVAGLFGMNFWSDEGFQIHTFHTAVIDRAGNLAANLEGNQFTSAQLIDLVGTVLRRPGTQGASSVGTTRAVP